MSKIISILGVISSVLFATAPQFSTLQPKTAAWLTLIGTVATAASGALVKYGSNNIYPTIIGVAVAVISVLAGANDLIPSNIVFILTVAGTALASFGKSLFGIGKNDDDDVIGSSLRGSGLGVLFILGISLALTACDKSNEYAKSLDRVSGYIQTGQELVDYQISNQQINASSAIAIVKTFQTINAINGNLIAETKLHLSPDGKSLILDKESKGKLLAIIASGQGVATKLLADPAFTSLPDESRTKYTRIINELVTTINLIGQLVDAVKLQEVK